MKSGVGARESLRGTANQTLRSTWSATGHSWTAGGEDAPCLRPNWLKAGALASAMGMLTQGLMLSE